MKIRAKWLLAKSYRWTHRYDESIAIMEELKKSPAGQGIPDLSATMATVYAKKNDYDKAIAIRTRMFERLPPASAAAADIAFKIAFLHVDENKYEEAIPLWRQVASKNSAGRNKILAHWYIGWCYYKLKDYDAALAEFDDLLKGAAKAAKIPDRVIYWKGRTLLALGRGDEAASSFREVIEKYPRGYYAELAKRRLKGDVRGVRDFAHARETWKSESDWMPRDPSAVSGIPHMRRALELDKLGLHEEVGREIRSMNNSMSAEAAEVALWLACKNFAHDVAYQLAQHTFKDILRNLPESRFDRFVWEQSYPKAYDPIVARANSKGDLDSKLVWSIMRNESNFRPHVVSPAGAVGLMQLMPTTAGIVAKDLGEEKISVKDLHKPGTNIAYGITYLEQLSKMFPENEVAVIASYNAGEQAVDRWLKNGSFNDIEEWIEEIPYSETNLYVKKVLNSYWDYQKLYGQQRKQSRQGKQRVIGM
jgi:soluble lytic murein transglycosylase